MLVNQNKHSRLRQIHAHHAMPYNYRVKRNPKNQHNASALSAESINKNLSSVSYFVGFLYLLLITIVISGRFLT